MGLFHFSGPFEKFLGAFLGLAVFQIIFLAKDEQHNVGVLLDGARLTQIGQLRALVLARFNLSREL